MYDVFIFLYRSFFPGAPKGKFYTYFLLLLFFLLLSKSEYRKGKSENYKENINTRQHRLYRHPYSAHKRLLLFNKKNKVSYVYILLFKLYNVLLYYTTYTKLQSSLKEMFLRENARPTVKINMFKKKLLCNIFE